MNPPIASIFTASSRAPAKKAPAKRAPAKKKEDEVDLSGSGAISDGSDAHSDSDGSDFSEEADGSDANSDDGSDFSEEKKTAKKNKTQPLKVSGTKRGKPAQAAEPKQPDAKRLCGASREKLIEMVETLQERVRSLESELKAKPKSVVFGQPLAAPPGQSAEQVAKAVELLSKVALKGINSQLKSPKPSSCFTKSPSRA
eukprot:gene7179-285_t